MKLAARNDDKLWAAIAEPSRCQLIDLLCVRGELSASKLAVDVPFSRQATVKHLVILKNTGIVSERKQGKEVLFTIRPDGLQSASHMMRQAAARWEQRLVRIKAIADKAKSNHQGDFYD